MTDPEITETTESFIAHLIELRNRLIRALIAVGVVFVCLFPFAGDLYAILAHPLLAVLPKGGQMIATDVTTPFFVPMKVAMMASFVVALPYVLYQIWAFVAPGMYAHEKRLVAPLVVASTVLFLCGMSFAYFLVFPIVFGFVTSVAPQGVAVMTDINKYLDFVLTLFIAFGITFEVPVAVVVLVRMGVVSVAKLREIRPYIIVGAFVIGAIFTPPDVVSQIMLAVPLWLLYEVGIVVSALMVKKATAAAEESEYQPLSDEEMERELDAVEAGQQQDKGPG
ncbi:MAG: twin-arginine translocase subunit TatC [Sulfuricella sp.]|nr:twin-arginine translocase subunit TatC [Sulfuricella sp.]